MNYKKTFTFFVILIMLAVFSSSLSANNEKIYNEQFMSSKAIDLKDKLPDESQGILKNIGIKSGKWNEISDLTPNKISNEILNIGQQKIKSPLKSIFPVIAIIIICSTAAALKPKFCEGELGKIIEAVAVLCVCISLINPIVLITSKVSIVIKSGTNFILFFAPIMAGIMVASGQTVTAGSYQLLMISMGQIISRMASTFLIPVINFLLGMSIISSVSTRLNFKNLCNLAHDSIKILVEFTTFLFLSLLTIQNLVSTSADNLTGKAARFAVNAFVPIVGGALSEAFSTVQGGIKLLKSGIGAFGVVAIGAIFLPLIIECIVWIFTLNICTIFSETFDLKKISSLTTTCSKVMTTLLAIIFSSLTILIISVVIVLIIGGNPA